MMINQTCGCSDMRRSTEKEDRKYLGWWNIFYIDNGIVSYRGIHIVKMDQTAQIVHFIQ